MKPTVRSILWFAVPAAFMTAAVASAQQFQPPSYYEAGSIAVATISADFNRDGSPDLAVMDQNDNKVVVLLNQRDGTFKTGSTFPIPPFGVAMAVGDLNRDGTPDLLTLHSPAGTGTLVVSLGNGDGTFNRGTTFAVGQTPTQVVVADFNGDGHPDVAVVNFTKGGINVFIGDGLGGLGIPASYRGTSSPLAIAAGDVNRDGHPDLLVAGEFGTLAVLLNTGAGTFTNGFSTAIDQGPISMALGDLNHDGKLDVVIAVTVAGAVDVLLGKGDGTFPTRSLYSITTVSTNPRYLAVADFNLDGNPDVIVATIQGRGLALLYGNGDGTLQTVVRISMQTNSSLSLTIADFNHDAMPDFAAVTGNGKVGVFLNAQ